MSSPSRDISAHERILDNEEIESLKSTPSARRLALEREGIVMDSERVSYDEEFGYIYRYDVVNLVETRPWKSFSVKPGDVTRIQTKFILYTKDGEQFSFASRPSSNLDHLISTETPKK